MSLVRLRTLALILATGAGLSACAYGDGYGYGYGGVSLGYGNGGYYGDCHYGRGSAYYEPWYGWYGWYGDYYYPGFGVYVYDSYRRPHRWNDNDRRYWEGRRSRYGERNWNDRRWERWEGWGRNGGQRREGRSGLQDRSGRRDWNDNQGYRRQGTRTETGVQGDTRVRSGGNRVGDDNDRPRGEWRNRGAGTDTGTRSPGEWRGRRGRH
ncbi:MAG: peptidase [Allosphingosinicella sp.]